MVKIPLPEKQGIAFASKPEVENFLAETWLRDIRFRRHPGLLERWTVTAFDVAGWRYTFTTVADQGHLWLFGWPPEGAVPPNQGQRQLERIRR